MTGYTYELVDRNLSFNDFALLCSRAFGVLITLRDEPLSAPIPEELEPSDYYKKQIEIDTKKLADIAKLKTPEERTRWAKRSLAKMVKHYRVVLGEADTDKIGKMTRVLTELEEWTPPTADHEPLKAYMRQQLKDSIEMKRRGVVFNEEQIARLENTDPLDHYASEVRRLKEAVAFDKKQWKEEVDRTNERNRWLKKLRGSLK